MFGRETRSGLTVDDGMMIWKARDAYRVQTVLLAVFYLPQFIFAFLAISYVYRGLWAPAVSMALAILALWMVRWVLCTGVPRLARWSWSQLRRLRTSMPMGLLLVGLCGLSGCMEYSYRVSELYGLNCRPEALQHGHCVTSRGGKP